MGNLVEERGFYRIFSRERIRCSPPEGMKQNWTEYQVKLWRRIVSRHDTLKQARAWVDNQRGEPA